MLSWRRTDDVLHVRIHRMFQAADSAVLDAVARTVSAGGARRDEVFARFVDAHRVEISASSNRVRLRARGRWHDLNEILAELNERLLDNRFEGQITWGRRAPKRNRRTIRLGAYFPAQRLVRIHPALDQAFVPRYVVEWIVFHEMLHQLVPIPKNGRRRQCHTPQFKALESTFPDHERAKIWEKAHLNRLLRS